MCAPLTAIHGTTVGSWCAWSVRRSSTTQGHVCGGAVRLPLSKHAPENFNHKQEFNGTKKYLSGFFKKKMLILKLELLILVNQKFSQKERKRTDCFQILQVCNYLEDHTF